ncbi:MAG: adenosylmethionine--8-amino-7-oxononanoate transaminase [Desulfovibrio sp.]|jgi:adenosylmethionine-8-amino-7-oxononanoate aminotransferase|nr:adenosylmethionine--8-amino-7-oxononanoate transaminase [Desulfovibrio sp.]
MPERPLRAVFVCGTGTDVGKTIVTATLLRALRTTGVAAQAVKPVQTGVKADEGLTSPRADAPVYAQAVADIHPFPALAPAAALRCFALPVSPHLAAAAENAGLSASGLCADIRKHWRLHKTADMLLLESAGGLCSPLNENEDMRDIAAGLDIPLVLVCPNRLGTLSDLGCALAAIGEKGLSLAGLVMTRSFPVNGDEVETLILEDNLNATRARLADVPVLALPYFPNFVWEDMAGLLAPLVEKLRIAIRAPLEENDLVRRDRKTLWHPYSSTLEPPVLNVASRSRGNRIILADGRELVDGMSSWWAAIHGYNHPRLLDALRGQAGRMPHVMFGGLTHAPAVELAERLVRRMPEGLERVFFADSGSVAVEVAMKMALQYQQGKGMAGRIRFLAPYGGYHGDTLGAMSVCDPVAGMHGLFARALPGQIFMERPRCRFDAPFDPASLDDARRVFDERAEEIAAVILEPVVQGAGGMWFYHPDYLLGLAQLCRAAGALLIFDEIATGFGRTGRFFAAEWAGVRPDILCCGKALTGGTLTMAATACTEEVAAGICADGRVFMHGPTFMGNPLACSVALASLDLLEENHWRTQVACLERQLEQGLVFCRGLPDVSDVRVLGAIGVVEMCCSVNTSVLQGYFVDKGVWIRPFGRLIYLMPPYITPADDVARLCAAVTEGIREGAHLP